MRINKRPKEFHEKGHSSLQAGNEGEKGEWVASCGAALRGRVAFSLGFNKL